MKLHAVFFLQNTLLVFGQLQRPWTARDCQEVRKSFTPWLVLQQGFLSLSMYLLLPWVFDMTSLGGDRWEGGGAEEGKHG